MAPVNPKSALVSELSVSSLELDRRSLPAGLFARLSLPRLSIRSNIFPSTTTYERSASPLEVGEALRARNPAKPPSPPPPSSYQPGGAAVNPYTINNNALFALFGILGASLVLASIWFFFWAKNGGFHFRKGDWEDYKSTVLRRKGPDGKTLSNATKRTQLGGGSIVASLNTRDDVSISVYNASEKVGRRIKKKSKKPTVKNSHDDDVRAYRHEKPARVGGLNREADGSYHDYTGTDPSDISSSNPFVHAQSVPTKKPKKPSARISSYVPGTESTFSTYSDDSHRPLRASPAHHSHHRDSAASSPTHTPIHTPTPSRQSRQHSPTKRVSQPSTPTPARYGRERGGGDQRASMPGTYTDPIDFESRYSGGVSEADTGTKSYFHPLPQLSTRGVPKGNGFRRGGGRRRDSLSDSEGETGTVMS